MTSSTPLSAPPRLQGIDALRGVLACGVMSYHYLLWTSLSLGTCGDRIFASIGLYAVEAFFVISGMSLAFAYRTTDFTAPEAIGQFAIRRYFRIAPLFYLVLAATLVLKGVAVLVLHTPGVELPSISRLLGNLTLLFGLTGPEQSVVIAGWSIGVEMVFYLLFPALAWTLFRGSRLSAGLVCGTVAAIGLLFSSTFLPAGNSWSCYVNVTNHLPFFVAGMLLARLLSSCDETGSDARRIRARWSLLLGLILFGSVSMITPEEALLVSGWRRGALSLLTIGMVGAVAAGSTDSPFRSFAVAGRRLGDWSFSIYLTHFLSFTVLQQVLPRDRPILLISAAMTATALASAVLFRWFETPMIALGKRVAQRWSAACRPRPLSQPLEAKTSDSAASRRAA